MLSILAPCLAENESVEEDGGGEREQEMGAEEDGIPDLADVDQITFVHPTEVFECFRPQGVGQDQENCHVEADAQDGCNGNFGRHERRIGQRMDDGDIAIQCHSDH